MQRGDSGKPRIHARDHEHGGADPQLIHYEDVGGSGSGGSSGTPIFAITGVSFTVSGDDTPIVLDTPDFDEDMSFYTSDSGTFDENSGRARILVPGMYVIGCQMDVRTVDATTYNTFVDMYLKYGDDSYGYSIEVPWLGGSLDVGGGEQIIGTRFIYPVDASIGYDVGLQRLHPISLTSAATFPIEIQPEFNTNADNMSVNWMGLWGWRLGEPLDLAHSN